MVSIGKMKSDLLNLFGYGTRDKAITPQANRSSEPDINEQRLMDLSDILVDPYLLRRYGKYLICLARENSKDGSVIL